MGWYGQVCKEKKVISKNKHSILKQLEREKGEDQRLPGKKQV